MPTESDRTPNDDNELDSKNHMFELFLSKGQSTKGGSRILPALGKPEDSLGPLELSSPRNPTPSIRIPEDVSYNRDGQRLYDELRRKSSGRGSEARGSISPRTSVPRITDREFAFRESSSISNLKAFLYKFFRNEPIAPVPALTKHELGLLSSVLSRKYGKTINFM